MPSARFANCMKKQNISADIINELSLLETKKDTIEFINQMDLLLTKEQCLSVMEEQGCSKTEKVSAKHREFGDEYTGKSIEERVDLLSELDTEHKGNCKLNSDGTITISFQFGGKGDFYCPCGPIRNAPKPCGVTLTYCGCCAGHMKFLYKYSLGVKLRLKEIVSSMANSDGEKPCEFVYEII